MFIIINSMEMFFSIFASIVSFFLFVVILMIVPFNMIEKKAQNTKEIRERLFLSLLFLALLIWSIGPLIYNTGLTHPLYHFFSLSFLLFIIYAFIYVVYLKQKDQLNLFIVAIFLSLLMLTLALDALKPIFLLLCLYIFLLYATFLLWKISLIGKETHYWLFAIILSLWSLSAFYENIIYIQYDQYSMLYSLGVGISFLFFSAYYLLFTASEINEEEIKIVEEINEMYHVEVEELEDVVISLARTLDAKDKYTEGHSERVCQYAMFLGERIGLKEAKLETLRIGALIHDIGKISLDLSLLNKVEKLSYDEFEEIKMHPVWGKNILNPLKSLEDVSKIVAMHHEKLDGSGYPDQLKRDEIPIEVRIVTLVDIFDALTTDRAYRKSLSVEKAVQIIKEEAAQGKLDSYLLGEFIDMLEEIYGLETSELSP